MKYYTGVGSRKTPKEILSLIKDIATQLALKDFTLRSGGAVGADNAFERGCKLGKGSKEIYKAEDCTPEAMKLASQFHPAWNRCTNYAKQLHGRNAFQVLGKDLSISSKFLICWTPDGCISHQDRSIKTGGTGTAISIADHYKIPIYNLKLEKDLEQIKLLLKEPNHE